MRFDDHRRVDGSSVRLDGDALSLTLTRTKTTGADRQVCFRHVVASGKAYLKHDDWLAKGHAIWEEWSTAGGDYGLMRCGHDGQPIQRELTYDEYVGNMRRILANLRFDAWLADGSYEAGTIGYTYALFCTAHSWRSFVPNVAAALGAPYSVLDFFGAWRQKGGSVYARALSMKSLSLQEVQAKHLRESNGDCLGGR